MSLPEYQDWMSETPLTPFGKDHLLVCNTDLDCMTLNKNIKMINAARKINTFSLPHVKVSKVL